MLLRRVGRAVEKEAAGLAGLEEAADTLVMVMELVVKRRSQATDSSRRRRRSGGGEEATRDDGEGLICSIAKMKNAPHPSPSRPWAPRHASLLLLPVPVVVVWLWLCVRGCGWCCPK